MIEIFNAAAVTALLILGGVEKYYKTNYLEISYLG